MKSKFKAISLTQGRFSLVDSSCFETLNFHKWHLTKTGYAASRINGKIVYMHRIVNNTPNGMETDHINRDKLDNRRSNLRSVTRGQNVLNVSRRDNKFGIRGVWFDKKNRKFCASIWLDGKRVWLGRYKTLSEAKRKVQDKEIKI